MKIYHQLGHNFNWNVDSYLEDECGDGLILSPINISYENLQSLPSNVLENSFFDPQIYKIDDDKGKIGSYSYYFGCLDESFNTGDLDRLKFDVARECVKLQNDLGLNALIIPSRYYENLPENYFEQQKEIFVDPFVEYATKTGSSEDLLLTVIIKKSQLSDRAKMEELLNQLTSLNMLDGFYIIFEFNSPSKQVKEIELLINAMKILYILVSNDFKVRIGYSNIEGILFSLIEIDSLSMGSYENLRRFDIKRFTTKKKSKRQGPKARLYSAKLYQFIEYSYVDAIKALAPSYVEELFPSSRYRPLMFKETYKWHFTKSEPYKHFFIEYEKQLNYLCENSIAEIVESLEQAAKTFDNLRRKGVVFDQNSDGSHIPTWLTVLNMWDAIDKGTI